MKTPFGAILVGFVVAAIGLPAQAASGNRTSPPVQSPAVEVPDSAPASLDERLGCGVMLVTIDEVLQRNPQLAASFSKGNASSAAMMPMFKLLGASGGRMLDKAYAEGAAEGLTPTALYRRGVADLSAKFAKGGGRDQAMAVFGRCMEIASPES